MKEQFDKELRNHIKDTFGEFDDHLADDGWRKLIDRKKRKRRGFIFWYALPSGVAASIALFLLLNQSEDIPYQNLKTEKKIENIAKENPSNGFKKLDVGQSNLDKKNEKIIEDSDESKIVKEENSSLKNSDFESEIEETISSSKSIINNKNTSLTLSNKPMEIGVSVAEDLKIKINENILIEEITEIPVLSKESEFNKTNNTNNFMESVVKISTQEKALTAPQGNFNQNIIIQTLEKPKELSRKLIVSNSVKDDTKNNKPISNKKKFKVGIDANTYINFSENGINDKINLGLGLVSEIKLTKQFSVNTGIMLNSQNSTFNGNQKSTQDFLKSTVAFSGIATVPVAQVTNAKLVGLDIPVNLKYALKFGKTTSFISSGFSSYSVINEKYVNEFSVISYSFNNVSTSNVTSINKNPEGKFSYFKFARTLDVSIGILYPLSKKRTLSIEPFMKYPLSGLGYQDLKIGSSGISFKMNFGK